MTLFCRQIRQQMEEQVAQKSCELEQYLQRVQELEDMYLRLQEALEDERQARQDEETVRKLQARCRSVRALASASFLGMAHAGGEESWGPGGCVGWSPGRWERLPLGLRLTCLSEQSRCVGRVPS